ncbi:DUF4383 domain-containing protein [Micromonospora sp. CPCC 205556]|uniref:DUF4383 domain-containing protein n=1 Tax=Micromonospora sp. CPCC 205556 TaxID=3122398 RepID=UPI002FF35D37
MTKLATWVCRVLGVLFVVTGLATFAFGEPANRYHNLLHFVTGLPAVAVGFVGSRAGARVFCLAFGASYLSFGAIGFAAGDPEAGYLWHLHVMHLAAPEHIFHLVLGGVVLLSGILTRSDGTARGTI